MKLRKELNDKVVEAIESYNKGGLFNKWEFLDGSVCRVEE